MESPGPLLDQLETYLMQPSTLYIALLFGALIVPLLEELFKPIGVWLLVGRKPSPAQGFAAGLLSGAGYALFENFSLGASAGEDWAMVVVARIGTSLIHIVTAGLMGWALSLSLDGETIPAAGALLSCSGCDPCFVEWHCDHHSCRGTVWYGCCHPRFSIYHQRRCSDHIWHFDPGLLCSLVWFQRFVKTCYNTARRATTSSVN